MKKIAFLSLGFCVVCMSAFASSPALELLDAHSFLIDDHGWHPSFKTETPKPKSWDDEDDGWRTLSVDELTASELNQVLQGDRPDTTLEFPAHSLIPLRLTLTGDLLKLKQADGANCGYLEVQQTLYVRFVDNELVVSTDLNEWTPFIEFITGEVSACIAVEDSGQPMIVIDAEVNRRS